MSETINKKLLEMHILRILEEYSDVNHHLQQKEIVELLAKEGIECDRRSVKANVDALQEFYERNDQGIEVSTEKGYCLSSRKFDDAELRMLIDSVLFSPTLTESQSKALIEKLESLSNKYFTAKVSHISNLPALQHGDNKQLLYVLDAINDAISEKKKISFIYNSYGTDFKLHPRREEPYIFNPYQMVAKNGHYYLIGNYDKYDSVSHYRLDKMTQVKVLKEPRKPMDQVKGLEKGLNLPRHMAEHVYMFSGESIRVRFRTDVKIMNELVDWFGKDFQIMQKTEDDLVISLLINREAFKYWALQYGQHVEVLEPKDLREEIAGIVAKMNEKYQG